LRNDNSAKGGDEVLEKKISKEGGEMHPLSAFLAFTSASNDYVNLSTGEWLSRVLFTAWQALKA
jgi:hypothetical protein